MLSKRVIKAINEGVLQALSFDDELPDTDDVTMHRISNDNAATVSRKELDKKFYSLKLLDMLLDPLDIDIYKRFFHLAVEWHEKYGATYNPHLNNYQFFKFVRECIKIGGNECNLNWINTSEVTGMTGLFEDIEFNGDISEWDTSNVTDMEDMFSGNKAFLGNIGGWDVHNVIDMKGMFDHAYFNLDISKWDVSNVREMSYMFRLSKFSLDISKWDVHNLKRMYYIFHKNSCFCLDLSKWDVSKVAEYTFIAYMGLETNLPREYYPKLNLN